jgi:site-specific recombinase XerD
MATLRYSDLRLTELCFLCPDSLDLESKRLSVKGKGNKPRGVPIPPALIPILTHYLSEVRPTLPSSPLVFVNPRATRRASSMDASPRTRSRTYVTAR